jgi:hypothetical protein
MIGITIKEPIKEDIYRIRVSKLTGIIFESHAVKSEIGSLMGERSLGSW